MADIQKITVNISDGSGTLERYPLFPSQFVPARNVDVWLPPGDPIRRPVLYMHDGQNIFDPALAYVGVDWGVDEAVSRMAEEEQILAPIIVGIWNSANRFREYMPQKAFSASFAGANLPRMLEHAGGLPVSDAYLRFMAAELKPFIDSRYRTLPDPGHTSVMGSSMGGLISLYAALEYPQVFGAAGCVSTAWPAGGDALIEYFQNALPQPGSVRLYFDYGTETLDAGYEPYQLQVDRILEARGYQAGKDWLTLKFEGADHSETSWRKRVHLPLKFLLAGPNRL